MDYRLCWSMGLCNTVMVQIPFHYSDDSADQRSPESSPCPTKAQQGDREQRKKEGQTEISEERSMFGAGARPEGRPFVAENDKKKYLCIDLVTSAAISPVVEPCLL